tara:strand:- start:224 stop:592 length:369 start_codon:yes stop_codon:yes gene_type:complete
MYFCVAEVPVNAEELKAKKEQMLKKFETTGNLGADMNVEHEGGIDPEGRRMLRNELVWPWRYVAPGVTYVTPMSDFPSAEHILFILFPSLPIRFSFVVLDFSSIRHAIFSTRSFICSEVLNI